MEQFFSIVRKNALKMRRMRKLVNYVDPHHRILSDALDKEAGIQHQPISNVIQEVNLQCWPLSND